MNIMKSPLKYLILTLACGTVALTLRAQEEQDRPVGEVTKEMLKKVPKEWVGAGGPPGADAGRVIETSAHSSRVLPTPQETYGGENSLSLGSAAAPAYSIGLLGEAQSQAALPGELNKRITKRFGRAATGTGGLRFLFSTDAAVLPLEGERMARSLRTMDGPESYVLKALNRDGQDYVLVLGKTTRALWRALPTVAQLIQQKGDALSFPDVEILDYPQMLERALITDLGGQGFMVGQSRWEYAQWQEFVDWMVDHKFNELWLEVIGSGRLMGNLNPEKGEWIGFPLQLKSYPQLVAKDRPIKRWDEKAGRVVDDKYTAPNVRQDFARDLIDYAQARGVKCVIFIGYDYFANQLPYTLGVPANDPSHRGANKIYDTILKEVVERYSNVQGVIFHTIENKNVPPSMVDEVVRRAGEGTAIVKEINPAIDTGMLNDYLEWRPREEFERYSEGLAKLNMYQVYAPHSSPQNKSWLRIHRDVFRYKFGSQYAWDHVAYLFPERFKREMQEDYINGYRKVISQAWYAEVFTLNYQAFAGMAWNSTGTPLDEFWDTTLERAFGPKAKGPMRTALAHTRFDLRFDIISRIIIEDRIDRGFQFWDMYRLTQLSGINDQMLADLEQDAAASLAAAQEARPLVTSAGAREMCEMVITSAERRYYLATSGRQFLKARAAEKAGDRAAAIAAIDRSLAEGAKLERAAAKLGIEYPMATHDDEVVAVYRQFKQKLQK
jgi:hypothetical protein